MAAGELANVKRARLVGKVKSQIGFELGEIELFAGSNSGGMVYFAH
jgi:hypothetical protein